MNFRFLISKGQILLLVKIRLLLLFECFVDLRSLHSMYPKKFNSNKIPKNYKGNKIDFFKINTESIICSKSFACSLSSVSCLFRRFAQKHKFSCKISVKRAQNRRPNFYYTLNQIYEFSVGNVAECRKVNKKPLRNYGAKKKTFLVVFSTERYPFDIPYWI